MLDLNARGQYECYNSPYKKGFMSIGYKRFEKSRLRQLVSTGDEHFIEVIKHSIWALIILGSAAGIQFIFDLLIARRFGANGTGIFYLCFSVIMILTLFGYLGLDRTVIRLIPPLLNKKDYDQAQAVKNSSLKLAFYNTLAISILLFIFAGWISNNIFHNPSLTSYLRVFSLSAVPFALRYIYGGVLRSLKRTKEALIIERIVIYALGVVSILTLGFIYGLMGVAVGFVIACFIALGASIYFTNHHLPKSRIKQSYSYKILLASGLPLLFVAFATTMIGQASVLILGAHANSKEVGIFSAALKISLVLSLILTAINTIAGTTISELYAKNEKQKLEILFGKVSAFGFLLALPLFLVMFLFPSFVLGLFGPEFTAGDSSLMILAVGQLINIAVGPTLFILAMTGHEKALAGAVGVSLVVNIVMGLVLIPSLGVFGAGLVTAVTITVANIIMLFLVKRYLGVWSLPFKYLRFWLNKVLKF